MPETPKTPKTLDSLLDDLIEDPKNFLADIDQAIKEGLDLNATTQDNSTLLIEVVRHSDDIDNAAGEQKAKAIIDHLLSKGANIDQPDMLGDTPLMVAIQNDLTEIASYLLEKNANPSAINKRGKMPLSIARTKQYIANSNQDQTTLSMLDTIISALHAKGANEKDDLKKLKIFRQKTIEEHKQDPGKFKPYYYTNKQYQRLKKQVQSTPEHTAATLADFTKDNPVLMAGFKKAAEYFTAHPDHAKYARSKTEEPYSYILATTEIGNQKEIFALINGNVLGEGAFGKVKLAMNAKGDIFAVKIEDPSATAKNPHEVPVLRATGDLQAQATRRLSTPAIFKDTVAEEKSYKILHLIKGKSLDTILDNKNYFTQSTPAQRIMLAINAAQAIAKIHDNNILHRDIKPGNFVGMLDFETGQSNLTVLDFGFARMIKPQSGETLIRNLPGQGTEGYMDNQSHTFSFATDMLALGITLDEIFGYNINTGLRQNFTHPFSENTWPFISFYLNPLRTPNHKAPSSAQMISDKLFEALKATPELESVKLDTVTQFRKNYIAKTRAQQDLLRYANRGDSKKIEELLKTPDININIQNEKGETPLMLAFAQEHFTIVEQLLKAGANPAVGKWTDEMKKAWLEYDTPLIAAIKAEDMDMDKITRLINAGVEIDRPDVKGNTALMWAIGTQDNLVTLLLEKGASLSIENYEGDTALDIAKKLNVTIPGLPTPAEPGKKPIIRSRQTQSLLNTQSIESKNSDPEVENKSSTAKPKSKF